METITKLPKDLNARTVPPLLQELREQDTTLYSFDMSAVRMVRPAGVCFLTCLLAILAPKHSRDCTRRVRFLNLPSSVESFLSTLGFFSTLKKHVALTGADDAVAEDERRRQRNRENAKRSYWQGNRDSSKPLVWPIETVFKKPSNSAFNIPFESDCAAFIDRAVLKFRGMFVKELGMEHIDQGLFWQSNRELYKNIYDHSESWGIVSILGRPNYGTIFTYHDIGIGILASINSSLKDKKLTSELDAIKWAIVEGNSSKKSVKKSWSENSGVGLSIVCEMVINIGGRIEIRSGKTIYYHDGGNNWNSLETDFFPGTHVSVFIPST